MQSLSNVPMVSEPLLWELDEQNYPKDYGAFKLSLKNLADYRGSDIEKAKACFRLLLRTSCSQLASEEGVLDLYHRIFKRYGDLFSENEENAQSWVKVRIGDGEYSIPKNLFVMQSPKYRAMLNSGMRESLECTVRLQATDKLLTYLTAGEIEISADNVISLLEMACREFIPALEKECVLFLRRNMGMEDLVNVLEFALQHNIDNLIWHCLSLATANYMQGKELIEADQDSEAAKILDDARRFASFGLVLSLGENNGKRLQLVDDFDLSSRKLSSLVNFLATRTHYQYNVLKDIPINDEQLEILSPYLSTSNLSIIGAEITRLPASIASKVEKITLKWCDSLIDLKLPLAKKVDCRYCYKLSRLEAPLAKKIDCKYCYKLSALEVPAAEEIYCDSCRELTILKAPVARKVDCFECHKLIRLEAPEAREINCGRCYKLLVLGIPKVKNISCSYCYKLSFLDFPEAEELDCSFCERLFSLNAPKVKNINCSCCYNLIGLKVLTAETLNCSCCYNLIELEAPRAKKIDCNYCERLPALRALNAEKVDCVFCEQLLSLEAPRAKKIDCSHCYKLTDLDAPEAKNIRCIFCRHLLNLQAPKAKKIVCNFCWRLKRLDLPEAEEIFCGSCANLLTLEAPEARKVNCYNCCRLQRLIVPKGVVA